MENTIKDSENSSNESERDQQDAEPLMPTTIPSNVFEYFQSVEEGKIHQKKNKKLK